MKRAREIYIKIIDEANILAAIEEVNSTHRWNQGHKPNRTVLWVESTKADRVKENWQTFKITKRRLPNALGYRYGRGFTFIRKNTLLRIKRKLKIIYRLTDTSAKLPFKMVNGMMSRLGQLKHCNSKDLRGRLLRQNFVRMLKNIIRKHQKSEVIQWNTVLQKYMERKSFVPSPA